MSHELYRSNSVISYDKTVHTENCTIMKYKHYNTLIILKANNRKQDITPHDYCATSIMD